jgi:glycosyltransferase involved in cell wall biosynthesis
VEKVFYTSDFIVRDVFLEVLGGFEFCFPKGGFMKRIVAFMNAYSEGKSGGDMCFIAFAKRSNDIKKLIVTSQLGKRLCENEGVKANFLITTREDRFRSAVATYFIRIIRALFLNIKTEQGDVIYASSDFLPDVLPAWLLKVKCRKSIFVQKVFHLIPRKRIISRCAQELSFVLIKSLADLIIVDNALLKDCLVKKGFSLDKIQVNYPGIDTAALKPAIQQKKYDAIFLGRIHPSKGVFDLIEIWRLVAQRMPRARLAIAGSGNSSIMQELSCKISVYNLDKNIDLLGFIDDANLSEVLNSARVFVFPSHEEGFGIAIAEAMACGLPVVAWNLPLYKEVFPKGLVPVKEKDATGFAEAVMELLDDNSSYQNIARQALECATLYDFEKTARKERRLIETAACDRGMQ